MKPIEQMTVEEMRAEMRTYKLRESEKYIFISYSHMDSLPVYRKVLSWMREGYNIYIDLDFSNHGSEDNWVDLMQRSIRRNNCALFISFRSKNAAFSYAAFLELLTVRSERTTKLHFGAVPIDVINITNFNDDFSIDADDVDTKALTDYYKRLSAGMGSRFCENNDSEGRLFKEGLESWFKQKNDQLAAVYDDAAEMLELIETSYEGEAASFFPCIANFAKLWFRTFDLNGNTKSLSDSFEERFANLRLRKSPTAAVEPAPAPKAEPVVKAEPKPAPAPKAEPKPAPKAEAKPVPAPKAAPAPVIKPAAEPKPSPAAADSTYPIYYRRSDHRAGILMQTAPKAFTVLPGAEIRKGNTATCPPTYIEERDRFVREGLADDAGEYYVLNTNVEYTSKSTAAGVLVCRSVSGQTFWVPCDAPESLSTEEEDIPDTAETAAADGEYFVRSDGNPGYVKCTGKREYLLLRGNSMKRSASDSCPAKASRMRNQLIAGNLVREDGDSYILTTDVVCSSLSLCACILCGYSISGNAFWVPGAAPEEVSEPESLTLADFRELCTGDAFPKKLANLRATGKGQGFRGIMDFAMAILLGGCNNPTSPAQLNYCKVVSSSVTAAFTWQSNCRTALDIPKSGKIDAEHEDFFASTDENTPLSDILAAVSSSEGLYAIRRAEQLTDCMRQIVELAEAEANA